MSATMAAPFSLREAQPGEGEDILPCYEWLFASPGAIPPNWNQGAALSRLENTLANPGAAVFLAERDMPNDSERGHIGGLCSVYIDIESVRYGLRGWVEDLAVAPECRSEGVGASLLRAVRDWARGRGATHLELDSGIRRVAAHRFYEQQDPTWTGMQYAWQL